MNPESKLEVYLVGGAVRDQLLGLEVKDRDWVVVGSTPQQMLDLGFKPVGRDFPVFLHPQTHEEYALARTERKTGPGYTGFDVHTSPDVTLEEDLLRRDLTLNAIAQDSSGKLIDPHGGQADINKRLFRHVSSAFSEDPLRVLRVARFAARYHAMGFHIADQTLAMMKQIVQRGEIDKLVSERVWLETERALLSDKPSVYFQTLRACGALARLFPEIDQLFGVPQPEVHHPEIDTGVHVMMVVDRARQLSDDPAVIFAALTHDLGKASSPHKYWPKHHGHEAKGVPLVNALCDRLRVPNATRQLAIIVCEFHLHMHKLMELKPSTILKLLKQINALRQPERVDQFASVCQADSQGRGGDYINRDYPQRQWLKQLCNAALSIDAGAIAASCTEPKKVGEAIDQARIKKIAEAKRHITSP